MTDRQARYEARRRESGWRMIAVRLDPDTLAALERLAERYGGDRSAAVRTAINGYSPSDYVLMPVEPTEDILWELDKTLFPQDADAGHEAMLRLGTDVVPPCAETKMAYGKYRRLLTHGMKAP